VRDALPLLRALGFDDRDAADPVPKAEEIQKGTIVSTAFLERNLDPDPDLEYVAHIAVKTSDGPGFATHLQMIGFIDTTATRLVPLGTHALRFGSCSARYTAPESTLTVAPIHDRAYSDAMLEWHTGPNCSGQHVSQSGVSLLTVGRGRVDEIAHHTTNLIISRIDGKVIDDACAMSRSAATPAELIFTKGGKRKRAVRFDAQRYRYPVPKEPCSSSPSRAHDGAPSESASRGPPTARQRVDAWKRSLPPSSRSKVKECVLAPFVVASYENEAPGVPGILPVEVALVASDRGARVFENVCWLGSLGTADVDGDGRGELLLAATDCLSLSSARARMLSDRKGKVEDVVFVPDSFGHPEWTKHRGKNAVRTTAHDTTGESDEPLVRVFAWDGQRMVVVIP